MARAEITLSYSGQDADYNLIDFYDVAQALKGFERSLALTTHLILNNEVITKAPALKGAKIFATPPKDGSWKITATVIVGVYTVGTAPKDSPLGHLISSAYDYVVSETLGFHVDYDKTLGQQIEEQKEENEILESLNQSRFDSVIEKCEVAVRDMHRPIVNSETATEGNISTIVRREKKAVGPSLNTDTYEYVAFTERGSEPREFVGLITSYNINTYKGRIYVKSLGRPISFELADSARHAANIGTVVSSLSANAQSRSDGPGEVWFRALEFHSRSGQLKGLLIIEIQLLSSAF